MTTLASTKFVTRMILNSIIKCRQETRKKSALFAEEQFGSIQTMRSATLVRIEEKVDGHMTTIISNHKNHAEAINVCRESNWKFCVICAQYVDENGFQKSFFRVVEFC